MKPSDGAQILQTLRDILMEQISEPDLIQIPHGLIDKAENFVILVKSEILTTSPTGSPAYEQAAAIIRTLDDLQDARAERVWYHAYYQLSSDYRNCTEAEQRILDALVPLAAELRGVNP